MAAQHFTLRLHLPIWKAVLLILGLMGRHRAAAQVDLQFTVTTLQDVSNAPFSTWISLLASSLLPPNTPGAFMGTIPSDAVQWTCNAVEAGQLSFQAEVTVQGNTQTHQIQIQNIGGCDASNASPQGVELVYIDEMGASTIVICDKNTFSIGCQIYITGDDITQYYNGAMSNGATQVTRGGRRNLLDASCEVAGAISSTIIATGAAIEYCAITGIYYAACVGGAVVFGFFIGAITGCEVMSTLGCFPGESLAMLKSGQYKSMSELQIGDQVATWGENGGVKFDSIYAFGHVDGESLGLYFDITLVRDVHGQNRTVDTKRQRNLQLTSGHFIPTFSGEGKVIYKRAIDINVEDKIWAMDSFEENVISLFTVKEISMRSNKGLYNPFTLGGSIIVDGVVASTHSEWFLDDTFAHMGIDDHWLPFAYQVFLFPIRLIYHILPLAEYRRLYSYIDKNFDIFAFGTKHGGLIASITWFGVFLLLGATLILKLFYKWRIEKKHKYAFVDFKYKDA